MKKVTLHKARKSPVHVHIFGKKDQYTFTELGQTIEMDEEDAAKAISDYPDMFIKPESKKDGSKKSEDTKEDNKKEAKNDPKKQTKVIL